MFPPLEGDRKGGKTKKGGKKPPFKHLFKNQFYKSNLMPCANGTVSE